MTTGRDHLGVGVGDLADVLGGPLVLDGDGGVVEPLVLVDLDRLPASEVVVVAARAVAGSGRIGVGVSTGAPDPVLGPLLAALVLAGLLQRSGSLAVDDALDAESFAYPTMLGGPEFRAWLTRRGDRPQPPTVADPVLVERTGEKLRVTLNRPERRNAYAREVRDALVAALQIPLVDDTVTAVVLDGAGPSFCSGGDLDEFGTTPTS